MSTFPGRERLRGLAAEWDGFAERLRRDLELVPQEDRAAAAAGAEVWVAAAGELHRTIAAVELDPCARCGRVRVDSRTLATQADSVRAALEGAVALVLAGPGGALAAAYGGDTRRAAIHALNRAAQLALEHARASACLAATCRPGDAP